MFIGCLWETIVSRDIRFVYSKVASRSLFCVLSVLRQWEPFAEKFRAHRSDSFIWWSDSHLHEFIWDNTIKSTFKVWAPWLKFGTELVTDVNISQQYFLRVNWVKYSDLHHTAIPQETKTSWKGKFISLTNGSQKWNRIFWQIYYVDGSYNYFP